MHHMLRVLLPGLIVLAATVCHAQGTASANAQHMQELAWIVGDWSAVLSAEKEIPGVVAKGDELRLDMSCEWGLGQNAIAVTWDVKAGETVLVTHKGMIGWDAGKKEFVSVGFDSTGKFATANWSKSGAKWRLNGNESHPLEGSTTRTHEVSELQSDQFTFQKVKSVRAGNAEPPGAKVVFKRVK